ncbi:iron-containing alcohol dehydrogenase [Adlercreutzia sp. ZJ242]|uniref:iron-containing alcohol dehydrogenase n=1 Tax=Adlercreutzia sp. ZJ242 TaxID=2709409 RepID=UPI0013EA2842|nr:iron-containing alcohol dehydrogenase [Adlercreutzia sp. ZJ242]
MGELLSAALPLVLTGIALAVLAASCSTKERRSRVSGVNMAMGACFGLLLGVALNYCGLWEDHAIGFAFGPLWGMALGAIYKGDRTR